MAWSFVAQYLSGTNKTAGTAVTASVTAAVGDKLFACCVCDDISGADAIGTTAVTSSGDTWTRIASNQSQTAQAEVATAVFICSVASTMTAKTVTFTPNATSPAKCFLVLRFSGGTTTMVGTVVNANGSGTGPGAAGMTTSTNPGSGDLVIGVYGLERPLGEGFTADTDTTNGSWAQPSNTGPVLINATSGGSAVTNVRELIQYKITTGAGAQTWDAVSNSAEWRAVLFTMQADGGGGPANPVSYGLQIQRAVARAGYR